MKSALFTALVATLALAACGDTSTAPTCVDGIKNGAETDVDCGGPCKACVLGKGCASEHDCGTVGYCSGGVCVPYATTGGGAAGGGGGASGGGGGASGGGSGGAGGAGGGVPTDLGAQIALLRGLADDGGVPPTGLALTGAYVTALKPLVDGGSASSDPAGFFIQAYGATGPAIFVALDPATVAGGPVQVGDRVSFTVPAAASSLTKSGGVRWLKALDGLTKTTTGPAAPVAQDVSSVDFNGATAPDDYESELVTLSNATLIGGGTSDGGVFASSGSGYRAPQMTSTGTAPGQTDGGTRLRIRVPNDVADTLADAGAAPGCKVTITNVPLWRNFSTAQPSAWATSSVTLTCH